MKEITVKELKAMRDNGEEFTLIDVREHNEYEFVNIEGDLIPLGDVPKHADKFDQDHKVVVMCRSGGRSATAIATLEAQHKLENLYNLKGGILAWAEEIDPSKPKY